MASQITQEKTTEQTTAIPRPPVVVVLGHVDHGKTTLLDYIRKTNVVGREAGGITQSIGAYEIEHNNKEITFIDTPGHEAFAKIRSRGTDVADIAILVVAADDGVKPQTAESIKILQESGTPFVVAISKTDTPGANIEKVKADLLEHNVLLEGFGGNISWQAVSAKTGDGINDLLDLILLTAEVEGIASAPSETEGRGIIIESRMDPRRGIEAMVVLKEGVLRNGFEIKAGSARGKIKILENFLGERTDELHPSSPALIIGFVNSPMVGEEFVVAQEIPEQDTAKEEAQTSTELVAEGDEREVLSIILKSDTAGCLEAAVGMIGALATEHARVQIRESSIGDIGDNDVRTAVDTGALIIGFRVKANKSANTLAHAQGADIITSNIIYELAQEVEKRLESYTPGAVAGELEILAVFSESGNKQVVGGKVTEGALTKNTVVEIVRDGESIGKGRITGLQTGKQETERVESGKECGILLKVGEMHAQVGDHLRIAGKE